MKSVIITVNLEYGYGQDREPGVVVDVKYKNGLFNKRFDWGALNLPNLYQKHVKTTSCYHICTKGIKKTQLHPRCKKKRNERKVNPSKVKLIQRK